MMLERYFLKFPIFAPSYLAPRNPVFRPKGTLSIDFGDGKGWKQLGRVFSVEFMTKTLDVPDYFEWGKTPEVPDYFEWGKGYVDRKRDTETMTFSGRFILNDEVE